MPEALYQIGDVVQRVNAADQTGIVRSRRWNPQAELHYYDVHIGARLTSIAETGLRLVPLACSAWDGLQTGSAAGADAFVHSLTKSRVLRSPSRIAKSFSSARTQFYPHQFKPLLKLLYSAQRRLIIADDVGLGKTIEAGYILTELEAGRPLETVLVVVPARLRSKWQLELEKRFGQRFQVVGRSDLQAALRDGHAPASFRWIASYETLRSMLEALRASPISIDCLIFDEAHRLRSPRALQHRLGTLLCERSDAVIMLSATPIQTSLGDLHSLAKLLLPDEFRSRSTFDEQMADNRALLEALRAMRSAADDAASSARALARLDEFLASKSGAPFASTPVVTRARELLQRGVATRAELAEIQATIGALSPLSHVFTRTRKSEAIPDTPQRVADWLSIDLGEKEREIYEIIIGACRSRVQRTGWGADQSAMMMYRAVASCIPAAMRHFRDELEAKLLSGIEDLDQEEGEIEASIPDDLRGEVRRAVALFEQLGCTDSKLAKVVSELKALWAADANVRRSRRKCIIFSYFRGTVEYLADELTKRGMSCVHVHGGVPSDERERLIGRFLDDPSVDVLVTSDVSAEGVDLQRASVLFNYDLPWNPMVVEQRVGRIDRIGQEAKVLTIASFVVKGSIEERILQRLFQRVRLIESSVGEMDALLGDTTSVERLTQNALLGTLSDEELERQLQAAEAAFENQRHVAAELDQRAGDLLAVDQALLDEIRAATREHQIPSEHHVLDFVNRALADWAPGIVIPRTALSQTVRVDLRRAFHARPFAPHSGDSDRASLFMRWAQQDAVAITFSREVAYRHPNVEIIHATHPLVRWAAGGDAPPALGFSLRLPTSTVLAPGSYVWGLSFLESQGTQRGLRMVGAVVPVEGDGPVLTEPSDVAALVGELLDHGQDVILPWSASYAPDHVVAAIERARAALDGVAFTQNRREAEMHGLRESARVTRLRAGHVAALDRAEALLHRYRGEGAPPFVTAMQEAKVQRASERLRQFDAQSAVRPWADAERDDVAVGHLIVLGGSR